MELRVKPFEAQDPLSGRIREARFAVDLSQVELAKRLGVSTRTLQNWEAGKIPQPRHRRRVADFLAFVEGEQAA